MLENELREFFTFLKMNLGELREHEVMLLMLTVRSRRVKEMLGVKVPDTVLKREVLRQPELDYSVFLRKVKRLALLARHANECFSVKGVPVPPEATGVMVVVNPRHAVRAVKSLMGEAWERMYELAQGQDKSAPLGVLKKMDVRFHANLHRHASRKVFVTFDIDAKDEDVLNSVVKRVEWLPRLVLDTPRGYHVIVATRGREERAKLWKEAILVARELWGEAVEVKVDPMEPVPGLPYGGHLVRVITQS